MTAFSVSPAGNTPFPAQTDEGFPQFIQFQSNGTDLGGPDADTLDFGPGLTATRGVGENANIVSVEVAVGFRDVYGDDSLLVADAGNAINLRGTSGFQTITVDSGTLLPGQSVLVIQRDVAQGEIVVASGMTLLYRDTQFLAMTAGLGAAITLLMCEDGLTLLVCGDMQAL
jgi:hypothetical protein